MSSHNDIIALSSKHRSLLVFTDSDFQHAGNGKYRIQVRSLPPGWKSKSEMKSWYGMRMIMAGCYRQKTIL